MPAVASSFTFSLWVNVQNSLLKRPNQNSFAIKKKTLYITTCGAAIWGISDLPVPIS